MGACDSLLTIQQCLGLRGGGVMTNRMYECLLGLKLCGLIAVTSAVAVQSRALVSNILRARCGRSFRSWSCGAVAGITIKFHAVAVRARSSTCGRSVGAVSI